MRRRFLQWFLGRLIAINIDFIGVLRLQPGDALVMRSSEKLDAETIVAVEARMAEMARGRVSVLCLDAGWEVQVIRNYGTPG